MHMLDSSGCFRQEEARKTWVHAKLTQKVSSVACLHRLGEHFQGGEDGPQRGLSSEAPAQATAGYGGDGFLLGKSGPSGLLHRHQQQTHSNAAAASEDACASKNTADRAERQPTDWEERFENLVAEMGLIPRR